MKTCPKCGLEKDPTEFYKRPGGGRQSYCKKCQKDACKQSPEQRRDSWNSRERTPEEKAKAAERSRAWYRANKERHQANNRRLKAEHPERQKSYRLKHLYDISSTDRARLLETQNGVCAISGCGNTGNLHVDHLHGTKIVRGLLCGACNKALGLMKDNPERLEGAAAYLRKSAVVALKKQA